MGLRLELAKVGLWGSQENATPLTADDLREVAETFPEIGKAPVTLGHSLADFMPAMGWVVSVEFDEEKGVLYGDVELNDILAQAYSDGLYRSWSIGIRRRASDGKRYLHHLAFLGEVPPKIKDLKVLDGQLVYADGVDETWVELAEKTRLVSRAKTDWPIADLNTPWNADAAKKRLFEKGVLDKCCAVIELREGEDKPDALSRYHFPYCDIIDGRVKIVPKAVSAGIAYLNGARGVKVRPELAQKARPVLEKLRNRIEKEKRKEAADMAELEKMKEELRKKEKLLADYEKKFRETKKQEVLEAAKGKIPQEKLEELALFADKLPVDDELEFADETGAKIKKPVIDVLIDLLKSIPLPVKPEESSLSNTTFSDSNSSVNVSELMEKI